MDRNNFDRLVSDAEKLNLVGWDWSTLGERYRESELPWNFTKIVQSHLTNVQRLLDMGTGGGEWLRALGPLPKETWATEAWIPNIPIARASLEPIGVRVVEVAEDSLQGVPNNFFDLVVNRHESFDSTEVARVLRAGGIFITQQVGGQDARELNEALEDVVQLPYPDWGAPLACELLTRAGLVIEASRTVQATYTFSDVGSIIFYLKATPWQVEKFSVKSKRERLWEMHNEIEAMGEFRARMDRFLVVARKPH